MGDKKKELRIGRFIIARWNPDLFHAYDDMVPSGAWRLMLCFEDPPPTPKEK